MSSATFGTKVEIFSGGSYVEIKGATDIRLPRLQPQDPMPTLTHDITDGIEQLIHPKTFRWADGSCEIEQKTADAGQVALVAAAVSTTITKFKFTKPNTATVIVNAYPVIEDGANPINGIATLSVTFRCSGASPAS